MTDLVIFLRVRMGEVNGKLGRSARFSDTDIISGRSRWVSTSIHLNEGRGGSTKKDGMGIYPGRRMSRSAQRYPVKISSTNGASSSWGMGISGIKSKTSGSLCRVMWWGDGVTSNIGVERYEYTESKEKLVIRIEGKPAALAAKHPRKAASLRTQCAFI